jgi:hypothetical protein
VKTPSIYWEPLITVGTTLVDRVIDRLLPPAPQTTAAPASTQTPQTPQTPILGDLGQIEAKMIARIEQMETQTNAQLAQQNKTLEVLAQSQAQQGKALENVIQTVTQLSQGFNTLTQIVAATTGTPSNGSSTPPAAPSSPSGGSTPVAPASSTSSGSNNSNGTPGPNGSLTRAPLASPETMLMVQDHAKATGIPISYVSDEVIKQRRTEAEARFEGMIAREQKKPSQSATSSSSPATIFSQLLSETTNSNPTKALGSRQLHSSALIPLAKLLRETFHWIKW